MHSDTGSRIAAWCRQQWPRHAEKELQRAFDISESTAERVLSGTTSKALMEQMMVRWGWRFAGFVLRPLCGPIPNDELVFWLDDVGAHPAPMGAAAFVRDQLGLAPGTTDLVAYALNSLGWVMASIRGPNLIVRLQERGVDPAAIRQAQAWMLTQAAETIDIECDRAGAWVRKTYPTKHQAVQALDRYAVFAAANDLRLDHQWNVVRKPLDEVVDLGMQRLIREVRATSGEADQVLRAIAEVLPTSAIFRVEGDSVTSLFAGSGLGIDGPAVMGRNVMSRPDQQYAGLVHAHVLQATKVLEGTFHDLDIAVEGRRAKYRRFAYAAKPELDGTQLVTTSIRLIVNPRMAA